MRGAPGAGMLAPKETRAERRPQMIHVQHEILVDRTPQEAFAFVSDFEHAPQWQNGVVTSVNSTPGPIGVGTKFDETVRLMGRHQQARCEVTEFNPSSSIRFTGRGSSVEYRCRVTFLPAER